ncbi:MAG: hypothetical protein V1660_03015 [archaeon]
MRSYIINDRGDSENSTPFPEDDSYQDEEIEIKDKIPIEIQGYNSFAIVARAGEMQTGTFCGGDLGTTLEQGVCNVLGSLKHNAKVYLRLIAENRTEKIEDWGLAARIMKSPNLESMCKIVYYSCYREKIEPQLGKYKGLEKEIIQ